MIRENTGQNVVPHCFLLFGHFVVVKILDWIKNATKISPRSFEMKVAKGQVR